MAQTIEVAMRLVIRANTLRNELLSKAIVGEFDERGGTIGRSDSNTMALPDPERHVSRLQAEILFSGGGYSIRNVGSSNPIIVNGRPLAPGESAPLRGADRMTIGGYELEVSREADARASATPSRPTDPRTVIGASGAEGRTNPPRRAATDPAPSQPPSDPFADLFGAPTSPGDADPFAGLLGPSPAPATSPRAPAAAAAPSLPSAARLPDDFDPFADLASPQKSASTVPSASAADSVFGDLVGDKRSAPGTLDAMFDLKGPSPDRGDPLQAFLAAEPAPPAPAGDVFAFLDAGRVDRDALAPTVADDTPELRGAYRPPPVRIDPPPAVRAEEVALETAPLPLRAAVVGDAGSVDALWRAFCDGAHLSLPAQQTLTPELMRLIGATLRQAIEGTVQLSAVRTTAKQELHVAVTTIQTKNNNPLKFAPDASAALALLMQPPLRGFMAAPDAVQDAMADLLGHAVGTMAGVRAAMHGVLKRFEPAQLEARLSGGGVLDRLMPVTRRARLWELYLQHYERISESAREDFQELFGKAFVKAYEEQADRVAAAKRPSR